MMEKVNVLQLQSLRYTSGMLRKESCEMNEIHISLLLRLFRAGNARLYFSIPDQFTLPIRPCELRVILFFLSVLDISKRSL